MEGGKKNGDTDNEFHLLLGEIPVAIKPTNNSSPFTSISIPDLKEKSPIKIHQQNQEPTLSDESSLTYAFSKLNVGNGGVGIDYSMLSARNQILHPGLGNTSSNVSFDESSLTYASYHPYHHSSVRYHQESHNVQQPYISKIQQLQACKQQETQLSFNTIGNYHHAHAHYSRRKQQLVNRMPSTSHDYNSFRDSDFRSLDEYPYSSMHANRTGAALSNYDDHNSFSPNPMIPDSIYAMAKDQQGCRHLQKAIVDGNAVDIRRIYNEVLVHIVELMTHPFSNYLIQKLLEVCNEEQLTQILYVITRNNADLIRISCDMHGTRAIQKIVQTVRTHEQVFVLVSSLKFGIVTLIKNMNGNHVAQRCLTYLAPEYNEFLFEAATNNCLDLATDCHGCCVLQKCLTHSSDNQKQRLIKAITFNALFLSQNIYGNYVVQCIFDFNVPWATMEIVNRLAGAYWDLSIQKYSSNVIEKCLEYGGDEGRTRIVKELLNDHRFDQLMHHPFGNYVIQAALKFSMGPLREELLDAINPHVHELETSPYGKKVLSLIKHRKY